MPACNTFIRRVYFEHIGGDIFMLSRKLPKKKKATPPNQATTNQHPEFIADNCTPPDTGNNDPNPCAPPPAYLRLSLFEHH